MHKYQIFYTIISLITISIAIYGIVTNKIVPFNRTNFILFDEGEVYSSFCNNFVANNITNNQCNRELQHLIPLPSKQNICPQHWTIYKYHNKTYCVFNS
jgi:hypothetical protein